MQEQQTKRLTYTVDQSQLNQATVSPVRGLSRAVHLDVLTVEIACSLQSVGACLFCAALSACVHVTPGHHMTATE